jgi:hypothetical protein
MTPSWSAHGTSILNGKSEKILRDDLKPPYFGKV